MDPSEPGTPGAGGVQPSGATPSGAAPTAGAGVPTGAATSASGPVQPGLLTGAAAGAATSASGPVQAGLATGAAAGAATSASGPPEGASAAATGIAGPPAAGPPPATLEDEDRPEWAEDLRGFALRAESFPDGGTLPRRFTRQGEELSPALAWGAPPQGTRSLALIVEDPDAPSGLFTHWIVTGLPPAPGDLPEGRGADPSDVAEAATSTNDFGEIGWGPAAPPPGPTHRYVFRLIALDVPLRLPRTARRADFDRAVEGHVLAETSLLARYGRGG